MTIGDVGILAATVAFGHRMDRRPVLGWQAHDLAEDLARQVSADIVNELDVGPGLVGVVEDPANDLANPAVEFGDDRAELRRDRLAVAVWRGGSIAKSMSRMVSSATGSRFSTTTPPSVALKISLCLAT